MEPCPICGKECKNLPVHLRFCKKEEVSRETLVVDTPIKDKLLSGVLEEIKTILNRYQHQTTIKIFEKNGKPSELEITARILL